MKAILLTGHGGPDMLRYGDAPEPVPARDELLVDVHAASVNAADYKVRLGGRNYNLQFPHILGRDFSGVVAKAGESSVDFAVGDPVFGVLDAGVEGAYAEKLAVRATIVARKPDRLSHLQAAAMALVGITAIWAIEDTAKLQPGETILIQGGAGGVAGFAIQLAKYLGATVITTTSAANVDYVRSLGADRVIDYRANGRGDRRLTQCDIRHRRRAYYCTCSPACGPA
jgi:NADPH:quinone reductase-like Zn-dependent oxidoreductase